MRRMEKSLGNKGFAFFGRPGLQRRGTKMASLADMRLLKVGGLLTGFGLGQGAMFLAQTWLVAQNLTAALGEIGVGLAVLSLAQWTGDLGGALLLSRHAAVEESTAYVRAAV